MKIRLPARYYCQFPYETPRGRVDTVEEIDLAETVFLLVDVYGLGFDPGDAVPGMPPLYLKSLHALQSEMIRKRIRPTLDRVRGGRPAGRLRREHVARRRLGQFGVGEAVRSNLLGG